MAARNLGRLLIPAGLRGRVRALQLRLFGEAARFRGKTNAQIFDSIYAEGMWGRGPGGEGTSGSGSHTSELTEIYVAAVGEFLDRIGTPTTVVDLGCGDFSVGSRIAPSADRYLACDVSSVILARNRERWSLPNVEFRQLDVSTDVLPTARVAFVRQVLQHLSNADITRFVERLEADRPFDFLVVTEHLPKAGDFICNLDKDSGANIRLYRNSGVVLHEAPFGLTALERGILCEGDEVVYGIPGVIRTVAYRLK